MFYGGSVSPPHELPRKKFLIPPRSPLPSEMGGADASGSSSLGHGVHEGSLMWSMLMCSNYAEWATLMQCNFKILEV
jgi:hypothetical protein